MGKKVISFQLFGTDPMYTAGAIENAKLAPKIYPGWVCRFYCALDVPATIRGKLQSLGAEVLRTMKPGTHIKRRFWRMEAIMDSSVERAIFRDCDSRLNKREAQVVGEWLASDKPVHIMRDHPRHTAVIMGGMWGALNSSKWLPEFEKLYDDWTGRMATGWRSGQRIGKADGDQSFLRDKVWPHIKSSTQHMAHDDKKRKTHRERTFKVSLPGTNFVGQRVTVNNRPIEE